MNINNEPTIEPRTITGIFTKYIAKTIPLAFDESMSYYECLCALLEYINEDIVPDINNVNDGLAELQSLYTQLQDFVNNYFDNLDVQEAINNKLDEMVESGELTNLIKGYVDPIYQAYESEINSRMDTQDSQIASIDSRVSAAVSGSPAGVYADLTALRASSADHSRIYLTADDGYWNYYDVSSSQWESGGVYQSTLDLSQLNYVLPGNTKYPDFDTTQLKLTFYAGTYFFNNSTSYSHSLANDVVVDFDTTSSTTANVILYNESSNTISMQKFNSSIASGNFIIGVINRKGLGYIKNGYSVNGVTMDYLNTKLSNTFDAIFNIFNLETDVDWEYGYYSSSGTTAGSSSQTSIRTDKNVFIKVAKGSTIKLNNITDSPRLLIARYSEANENSFIERKTVNTITGTYTAPSNEYVRLSISYDDSQVIVDFNALISKIESNIMQIKTAGGINNIDQSLDINSDNAISNSAVTAEFNKIYFELPNDWSNKIQDIQEEQKRQFTFAIQTDTHFNKETDSSMVGRNLNLLSKQIGFKFIANLGDIIEGYGDSETDNMRSSLTDIMSRYVDGVCCPVIATIGNHDNNKTYYDSNPGSELITNNELYGRVISPVINTLHNVSSNGNSIYYYTDYDIERIRVIVLNTSDDETVSGIPESLFKMSNAQLDWLKDIALNTNYKVLILAHCPLSSDLSNNATQSLKNALTLIDNFKNNGGTVIACLFGHTHTRESVMHNGYPLITFINGGERCEVVFVDTENKTINTIPVGNLSGTRQFSYQ